MSQSISNKRDDSRYPDTPKQASVTAKNIAHDERHYPLELMLRRNQEYLDQFASTRVFKLAREGAFQNTDARDRLLDCLQVWSNHFQEMVHARVLHSQSEEHREVAVAHLDDELNHNQQLAASRTNLREVGDAELLSSAQWFVSQMATLSDASKTVLIHFVVEPAATVFYPTIGPLLGFNPSDKHFLLHSQVDNEHVMMGVDFLRRHSGLNWSELQEVQRLGWERFFSMFDRIADLSVPKLN